MILTREILRELFPHAKPDYIDAILGDDLAQGHITDKPLIHFLAQGAAETGGFVIYEESGAYSAEGLLKIFPKYFKSLAEARAYAKKPQAIFNKTYGGRLGNTLPGDGYKYRGRGIFQITGKGAYKEYGDKLSLDLVNNPELAAIPANSIKIAIAYWNDLKLSNWADSDDILAVSRGINGGNPKRNIQPNGMVDRKSWYAKIQKMLNSEAQPNPVETGSLRDGSSGDEVKRLQSALRSKGYAAGAIDGIYGANTTRAVTAFQTEHELANSQSGIWLAEYWPILDNAPNIQIERQAVTADDLHEAGDPVVTSATWGQRILLFLGFGGAITGGATDGASNFPALVSQYQPAIQILQPFFQWIGSNGWILVVLGAIAGWFILRSIIAYMVKSYRHFDYQGAYKEVKND